MRARITYSAALALLVGLFGCAAEEPRGRSVAVVESSIEAVHGIEGASVSVERLRSTFTVVDSATVVARLEAGATVADPGSLAEYLLRSLWTIGDVRPTELAVYVEAADGSRVDISSGAIDNDWSPVLGRSDSPFFLVNKLSTEPVKSKLGPWPGPVPTPPADAIVEIDDAASAQRSRSANAWIAVTIPSVSKAPSASRVK
ncbi:hypothetical protein ACPPVW_12865 [Leifsonia sp. McL0607]|uniref:hypothetical protein n=1 Tax=Leifsonia sp. McL0607 TaxID=3415672 RepID=UPI003CEF4629